MTRTFAEKKRILELWTEGYNKSQIAKETGIPRGTITDCIARFGNLENLGQHDHQKKFSNSLFYVQDTNRPQIQKAYTYLFGLYLDDGTVSIFPKTYKFRVFLDSHYPNIIRNCSQAMQIILPENKISFLAPKDNYVIVQCHSNDLIDIFPQFGNGRKHERQIVLMNWQQEIVDKYPLEFFRGCIIAMDHASAVWLKARIIQSINLPICPKIYARCSFTPVSCWDCIGRRKLANVIL